MTSWFPLRCGTDPSSSYEGYHIFGWTFTVKEGTPEVLLRPPQAERVSISSPISLRGSSLVTSSVVLKIEMYEFLCTSQLGFPS